MAETKLMEALRPRLSGFVAQAKALAHVPGEGAERRFEDLVVERLVRPLLPPSVAVTTGTVVARGGASAVTLERDLVLFSRERAPLIPDGQRSHLIPIEGILCQLRTVCTLSRKALLDLTRVAGSQDAMSTDPGPAAMVVAFSSDSRKQDESARVMEVLAATKYRPASGRYTSPVRVVCVVNRGLWLLTRLGSQEGWWKVSTRTNRHLLALAGVLADACYALPRGAPPVGGYFSDARWLQGPRPACLVKAE